MTTEEVKDKPSQSITSKCSIQFALAVASVALLAVCIFILALVNVKEAAKDALLILIGVVSASYKDVYGYFFGSSASSDRKTELLSQAEAIPPKQT